AEPATPPSDEPVDAAMETADAAPEAPDDGPPSIPLSGPAVVTAPATKAARAANVEQAVGTKWTVWIGGIALALGGIFLVRYSIEQGLLGPGVRVTLGGLFALSLAAAGEWTRRREPDMALAGPQSAYVPGILTAAGILSGYATIYAAYALYGFLGPLAAFILLAACSIAALAGSALHGPSLAALGLVGSYVTPALVASPDPSAWALFLYLLFVTAAAWFLASLRGWLWLALTAATGATLWGLVWCGSAWSEGDIWPMGVYIVGLAALALLFLTHDPEPEGQTGGPWQNLDWPVTGVLMAVTLLAWPAARLDSYSLLSQLVLAAACASLLLGAWRWENLSALVPWSAALFGLVYMSWHTPELVLAPMGPFDAYLGVAPIAPPGLDRFLVAGAAFGAAFAATGGLAALRSGSHPAWTITSAAAPIAIFAYAYLRATRFEHSVPFGISAIVIAGLYAAATEVMHRRGDDAPWPWRSGVYAVAAVAALALALTIMLEKGWLTIALALICPALAWISIRRPLPNLRYLAAGLAVVVAARLLYDPAVVGRDLGSTPIFNWLLYGYGVPAIALAAAAHVFRRRADDIATQLLEATALLFAVTLAGLQIRHLMNDGNVFADTFGLAEVSLHSIMWIGLAIGLQRLNEMHARPTLQYGSAILGALGLASVLVVHLVSKNPLVTGESIGDHAFFNTLILAYAVPGALCGLLHRMAKGRRPPYFVAASGIAALALIFAYLSLEVRTLFHGPVLTIGPTTDTEWYVYSAVWLLYGLGLLAAGLLAGVTALRLAAFAVIILTVAKVFLFDLSNLTGVLRAASFIGLGIVLMGIGYFYQKVLAPPPDLPETPEPNEDASHA
ncbi:MAG: DUF2339 domain-containing protein, partial [Methyloligellaceae bacterium]